MSSREIKTSDRKPVLGLPDIPVCEDQWFHEQYEEGRPEAVIVWMCIALGGLVSFLCGVAVGRWTV
jgi:hypothetical protein